MKAWGIQAATHRFALFGAIWAVLTSAEPGGLAAGALAVPAAVWASLRLLPPRNPLALWRLARQLPRFVAGSIAGGIDVARRAFSPSMRLDPGWVAVPVNLPDTGCVALGAELSLMPGTLAAGMQDGRLLVHLLDCRAGLEAAIPREEAAMASIFGPGEPPREGQP